MSLLRIFALTSLFYLAHVNVGKADIAQLAKYYELGKEELVIKEIELMRRSTSCEDAKMLQALWGEGEASKHNKGLVSNSRLVKLYFAAYLARADSNRCVEIDKVEVRNLARETISSKSIDERERRQAIFIIQALLNPKDIKFLGSMIRTGEEDYLRDVVMALAMYCVDASDIELDRIYMLAKNHDDRKFVKETQQEFKEFFSYRCK